MGQRECDDCEIEVRRFVGGLVGLRDRRDSRKPYLVLTGSEWRSFLQRIKRGDFDRPAGSAPTDLGR
jgi:hypothetical protein